MVILDTDHLSLFFQGRAPGLAIQRRISTLPEGEAVTTVVTYEEQTRGWLAYVSRAKTVREQVAAYRQLQGHLDHFRMLPVMEFSEAAAVRFQALCKAGVRVGTMDLRIAAIALTLDATVITRNGVDFGKVPGLRWEDWSKP